MNMTSTIQQKIEEAKERFDDFVSINDLYPKGADVEKLWAFIEVELTSLASQVAEEKEKDMASYTESLKENRLPEHKVSLHIEHNQHKAYYEKIEDYIRHRNIEDDDWAYSDSRKKAIENDSLWELQWYPNTPVGFNIVYGSTLEECIKKANEDDIVELISDNTETV